MRLSKNILPFCSTFALVTLATLLPATAQNRIVQADGVVLLKRNGSSSYHRTSVGAQLHPQDVLKPASGAKVVVRCNPTRRWVVPAGIPSSVNSGCPGDRAVVSLRGGDLVNVVGGSDPTIPYIISPRRTWLLNNKPLLKWNPIPGANSYKVRVKGEGIDWQTQVIKNEVVYAGEQPLQPGVTYLLLVEANTGQSSQREKASSLNEGGTLPFYEDDKYAGWGFSVLPEEDAKAVHENIKRILTWEFWELPEDTKTLAVADVYISNDLYAEAIDTLETLVQKNSQAPGVYQLLGDLYGHVGLNLLAEARYLQAVEFAKAAEDPEAEANARAGLARVYAITGNLDSATKQFEQAQAKYKSLGDTQRASDIERNLTELAKRKDQSGTRSQ
jgi:hypothetical protein